MLCRGFDRTRQRRGLDTLRYSTGGGIEFNLLAAGQRRRYQMDEWQEDGRVELFSLRAQARDHDRGTEAGRDRRVKFISLRLKLLVSFTLLFGVVFAAACYGFYLNSVAVAFVVTYVILFILVFFASGTLTRPITGLTRSAQRIAEGDYSRGVIPEVRGLIGDETTALVEVFRQMVDRIADREKELKEQVRELTLTMHIQIDQLRKAKKVAEITESEYFLQLQEKARKMREERGE
jgi:HAMP domain-containing protein